MFIFWVHDFYESEFFVILRVPNTSISRINIESTVFDCYFWMELVSVRKRLVYI